MASADGVGDITERIMEFQRREYAMLSRLAQREREMTKLGQECAEAFYAFDDNRKDSLRGGYVDPAVNIEITLLRQRLREKDQEISQVREELQNAQFQPNSIQGKKLLDKCQHLMEENAEIARQLSEEKMQVLRIQLAAERRKRLQLRQRSAFLDRYAEQADQENEKMEKKITDLGQSLKETRAEIEKHKKALNPELEHHRDNGMSPTRFPGAYL
ncbi:Wtap [Symbiodinium sp. CCMP2592]|nr:Wtap [Symbiodinium sp. CCMP2592]